MSDALAAVVAAGLMSIVVLFGASPLLRMLREPLDATDKIAYRTLATTRFVVGCAALAGAAGLVSWLTLPTRVLPLWTVLATFGVILAAIDAVTTWLPMRLTYLCWLMMLLAALATPLLGATIQDLLRIVAGGALAGFGYLVIWLVTRGGIEFGDVRFAPLLGAAAAAVSWPMLLWALLLGTMIGGIYGVVRLARHRQGGFPYAPSMLLGPYLAALLGHAQLF